MTASHPVVWRSRAVRYSLAILPVWFTIAVLVFNTPWRIKAVVGAFFAVSLLSPADALVAVAVAAPLGRLIGAALDLQTFRLTEAIVVAFLAGWLLRARSDHPGPRVPAVAGWLAALAISASVAAQAWRLAQYPGALPDTLRILYQAYYIVPDRVGFDAGARLLEGIGLLAATTTLFRARPRLAITLPAALCIGALLAACSSLLIVKHIGLAPMLADAARNAPRIAAHVGDVNAAGSYFGMMLLVAAGLTARERSLWSFAWLGCAAAAAAALWLSGSRTAIAATLIVGCASVLYAFVARRSRAVRASALAVLVVAALAAGGIRAWTLRFDAGTEFRRDFYATSARMIAARPWLGVGVGQYYDTSPLFLSRFLGWFYGFENAHNFFLQIAAELGIPGALPLIALLALAVVRGGRALLHWPDDFRLIGCEAGVTALLVTCLTGHPLLLDEVAFAFWMLTGMLLGLAGSALVRGAGGARPSAGPRPWPPVLAAATCAVVLTVHVAAARRPIPPSESIAVTGLEPWETSPDGTRYRWTLDYASVFVPRDATRVYVPVRMPLDLPQVGPIGIQTRASGHDRGRTLVGGSWATLDVELPPIESMQAYRRVDFKLDRTWQPAIYIPGSGDLRRVGVQMGEIKTFFEH